jgi:branched-chain amino acid transport system permease protein
MHRLLEAIITGLAQGSMIALIALGYSMVYGVLKLINFAHSEVFMMSAFVGLFLITALGGSGNPWVAGVGGTVLAMVAAAAIGVAVERIAYRPLRNRGKSPLTRITPLVTALGMSVLLQNLAQLLFTNRYRSYPELFKGTLRFGGGITMSSSRATILVTAVVVMVALELIVKKTWFGRAMRALSTNEEAAKLMGVRTSRVISSTFALGSALAALGAVLFCADQSQVYPYMGMVIGTRAFVAAVLGGIGSIPGAMLGGLLIGLLGELLKLTSFSGGVDIAIFVVLVAVLIVRPAGLLGSTRAEKV